MTQSEAGGVGWNQGIGLVLGAALVAAVFAIRTWFNRRSRIARRERPPQKKKLLRPPGYSLQCRIDEFTEKLNDSVLQAVAAGSVLGLLGSAIFPIVEGLVLQRFTFGQIWKPPSSYVLMSLGALTVSATAWMIASIAHATRMHRDLRNCRFGLRGEQAVAEALADPTIVAAGYTTFHDVPGDGTWNIDHVVVGPSGVFVLETKTRSRRAANRDQPEHKVGYDGQNLRFPWGEDRKAVKQVEQNTKWVRRFVNAFAPEDITFQPVIVVPGWFVEAQGTYPVRAMNAEYLIRYIAESKPRYEGHQLQGILHRLDERCRDLDF